jgi:hypothetical protein
MCTKPEQGRGESESKREVAAMTREHFAVEKMSRILAMVSKTKVSDQKL